MGKRGRDESEAPGLATAAEQADAARDDMQGRAYLTAMEAVEIAIGYGNEARLYLARRSEESGEWCHLISMPADTFDLDKVRAVYGGGHYRMQTRGLGSSGRKEWLSSAVFDIEGSKRIVADAVVPGTAVAAPAAPVGAERFYEMMLAQAQATAQQMMGIVLALVQGGGGGGRGSDPLQVIGLAKEIAALGHAPTIDPEKYIADRSASWEAGVKVGQDMKGGPRSENWPGFLKEVVPQALGVLSEVTKAQRVAAPVAARPDVPALPAGPAGVEAARMVPPWLASVQPYLPLLVGMARMGTSAEVAASAIVERLDALPDDVQAALMQDVALADWSTRVLAMLPPQLAQQFPGWTASVLQTVRGMLLEDQPQDAETLGEGEADPQT